MMNKLVKVLSARLPDVHEEAAKRLYDTYILPTLEQVRFPAIPNVNEPKLRMTFIRRFMTLADEMTKKAWVEGITSAAEFVGTFDGHIQHEWRMDDVILYKFNLRKLRPRLKAVLTHNLELIGLQTLCSERHLITLKGVRVKVPRGAKRTVHFGSNANWCQQCQAPVVFKAPIYREKRHLR